MIQRLGSIKITFYNLVFLISLMGAGVYLSLVYKSDFKMMNEVILLEWLKTAWVDTPVLVIWFVWLCLGAALLFINALCCITKQISMALRSGPEKWLFLVLHCLFVVVLICHGIILVVGSKQSNIELFPNESIIFENRYKIEVSDIIFADDVNILKADKNEQRELMTRKNIHRKLNFAKVLVSRDSKQVKEKKIFMLSPLRYGFVQVTLTKFIVKQEQGRDLVGVNLTITRNYLSIFFFVIYGLMILSLGIYILLIFRPCPDADK